MNCILRSKSFCLRTFLIGGVVMVATLGANAAESHVTAVVSDNSTNTVKSPAGVAAVPFKTLPDDATAAEVNGVKIPMKKINSTIASLEKQNPKLADGSAQANAVLTQYRQGMLNDLIDFQLLLQEAKERKIVPDSKNVDAAIWRIKRKFPTPGSFDQWLKATGKTETELRQSIVESMTVEVLGNKLSVDATVSDADLQKFYDDNKDRFAIPDSVAVSHILIAVPQDASDADKKKLQKEAESVLKLALKSGADFSALAAKYSDDKTSAGKGGSLGALVEVDKGSWKPIVDAAFAAKPGKVLDKLIKSDFGYHILDVISRKPGRTLTLNEVRTEIKPLVLHQKVEAAIDAEIKKLRKTATIKTFI